ncbi:MAG: methyltransferase domain-containing protein [Isosphaeraceae bacterium]|nr:methyltransferase domain-containing protein [Isosphaeraceae bacterium]
MRDHTKAFCSLAAEHFECPGPIFEFGSYQVEGQLDYADLRRLFPGKDYVGCDMRSGPGVDRVEDVSAMTLRDGEAGTILCIETFEHVFEVRRAYDEVFRALKPGGMFIFTSPLNFRIHGYPDDYWRMTPSCVRRMLEPYGARLTGYQGYEKFPHTVMAVAVKTPVPTDFAARAERFSRAFQLQQDHAKRSRSIGTKLREAVGLLYRSKGERYQVSSYFDSHLVLDQGSLALARAS